jgi:vacuolar-type H+-ATPase subunit H
VERGRLLDQRAAERHEQARKEAEKIRASAADEAEEVLAGARESALMDFVLQEHGVLRDGPKDSNAGG